MGRLAAFIERAFPIGTADIADGAITAAKLGAVYKVAFPFGSGWGNYGGGVFEDCTYSKIGRLVVLHGLATKTGGAPAASDVIGTLPAGYRPAGMLRFGTRGENANAAWVVDVQADGDVVWMAGDATETDYTSLSGIAFVVDA